MRFVKKRAKNKITKCLIVKQKGCRSRQPFLLCSFHAWDCFATLAMTFVAASVPIGVVFFAELSFNYIVLAVVASELSGRYANELQKVLVEYSFVVVSRLFADFVD